ncbi:MAG: Trm112 family protein [Terracidiphilus sp.]
MSARADKPAHPPALDPAVLAQLACPACFGDLRLEESRLDGARLVCNACRRAYAIVDGIPVLIIERAEGPGGES